MTESLIAKNRDHNLSESYNLRNNSKKLFYLKKGRQGWTIFGESVF